MKKAEVLVTRHPALVTVLKEQEIVSEDVKVLTHVNNPEEIRGKVVAGILPFHLAAEADEIIAVSLRLAPEDRGRELTTDELRERLIGIERFKVIKL